jgi:hypothetical protein
MKSRPKLWRVFSNTEYVIFIYFQQKVTLEYLIQLLGKHSKESLKSDHKKRLTILKEMLEQLYILMYRFNFSKS